MSIKLLSVDDSKTIRLIIAKAFRPYDCTMAEAANGAEALTVATNDRPDLIILDLTMPVMDGYETLKRLRADPKLKDIPVVMLTAEAGRENVMRIAQLGVQGYVIKPFDEAKIIERVGKVVPLKLKGDAGAPLDKPESKVGILVVDDKPAIVESLKAGLASTGWNVSTAATAAEALEACAKKPVGVVFVSLSLPQDSAVTLLRSLRSNPATKDTPVIGMSVKSAVEEQARAQQVGFNGIVTKPIALDDVKAKVARALSLDMSGQFFQHRASALVITVPRELGAKDATFVMTSLDAKASAAVDAGLAHLIVDLGAVQTADFTHVKLLMEALQVSQKAGLKCSFVGSPEVIAECRNFEETRELTFAASYDEALAQVVAA